jgi:hypothetical protein
MAALLVVLVFVYAVVVTLVVRHHQRPRRRDRLVDMRPRYQGPRRWTPPGDE